MAIDGREEVLHQRNVWLVNVKVPSAGVCRHRHVALDGIATVLLHHGATDATARAGGHLDKALVNLALRDVLECGDAVLHAVKRHVRVLGRVLRHGLEDSARGGEEPRTALVIGNDLALELDALLLEPIRQLLKGQDGIHCLTVLLALILLCDARTDKHRLGARDAALDVHAVRHHGRHDVREVGELLGEVLANQQVDRMTAR